MNKDEIKLLLEVYRPQDGGDPAFTEALRAVAEDPELAAWFEEMQRFDAVMVNKFQTMAVPLDVKGYALSGGQPAQEKRPVPVPQMPSPKSRWVMVGTIAAAVLLIGFLGWHFYAPKKGPTDLLAQQAVSFSNQMPPLQFVCFDAKAVASWINRQPGSQQVGLHLPTPPKSLSMAMIGSSVVDWNGKPVVMVCLQNQKQMAMLYILNGNDTTDLLEGTSQTLQKGDWVVRTTKADGQVRLLATKGRAEDLDFQLPF